MFHTGFLWSELNSDWSICTLLLFLWWLIISGLIVNPNIRILHCGWRLSVRMAQRKDSSRKDYLIIMITVRVCVPPSLSTLTCVWSHLPCIASSPRHPTLFTPHWITCSLFEHTNRFLLLYEVQTGPFSQGTDSNTSHTYDHAGLPACWRWKIASLCGYKIFLLELRWQVWLKCCVFVLQESGAQEPRSSDVCTGFKSLISKNKFAKNENSVIDSHPNAGGKSGDVFLATQYFSETKTCI